MHLKLMILRRSLKCVVSSPAVCPAQLSSEAPTRDVRRHPPSHSWIHGRVSFNCISQCTIYLFVRRRRVTSQQAFDSSPTRFAVSLLSLLTSSQVLAPRATFAEAPSFEVCPPKIVPGFFVFHQHFSSGALSLPSGYHKTARIPSIRSASHLSASGILLTFAAHVLIASPCSVTTSSACQKRLQDGIAVPTFLLLLAWPACTESSLRVPGSVCCPVAHAASATVSFRRCRCHTC